MAKGNIVSRIALENSSLSDNAAQVQCPAIAVLDLTPTEAETMRARTSPASGPR